MWLGGMGEWGRVVGIEDGVDLVLDFADGNRTLAVILSPVDGSSSCAFMQSTLSLCGMCWHSWSSRLLDPRVVNGTDLWWLFVSRNVAALGSPAKVVR